MQHFYHTSKTCYYFQCRRFISNFIFNTRPYTAINIQCANKTINVQRSEGEEVIIICYYYSEEYILALQCPIPFYDFTLVT